MPQVIIEQPGVPSMTVPLSGNEVRFGRADDNDIVLVAEEVSRHHAKIVRRGDKCVLLDLTSLNGTYVNRQRIVERVLAHTDEIWFGGKCRVVYRDDTHFGRQDSTPAPDSSLVRDLARIRAEIDRAGNNLTMMGQQSRSASTAERIAIPSREDLVSMSRAYRRLTALYETTKLIAGDFDINKRLSAVLDTAMRALNAERGFILLRDEQSSNLKVSVAREMGQELQASSPSMGIAGKAAIDGEPVLMENASTDEQFGMRESIIRQRITSAMCVPLKVEDRVLGSIYVDTRKAGVRFEEADLELFVSLAAQSAMAIDNVRLYERMVESEKKRANLGRFLSPAIVDEILKEESSLELGGRKRTVTAMFCDIRGFTPLTERITPRQMVDLLNEHFTAMTTIIFEFNGTLDKYIGDEIMAVFGAPLSADDDAERCVQASLAIQARNTELNRVREREGRPTLDIGIGVNTGEVIAGYMGSPMRMDFTVVGDDVNTARRLCDFAKAGQVVIGDATYRLVESLIEVRSMGSLTLEGKARPVIAYEALGLRG
jgi:adenylate cyclase